MAFDIFAIGLKLGKDVFVIALANVGDGLAVGFDDFHVAVVHPDAALKVALIFLDLLGAHVEDIGADFVDLLAADVGDVVFGQFGGGEHERLHVSSGRPYPAGKAMILCEGRRRSVGDLFVALAFGRKGDVAGHAVFAVGLPGTVDGLHGEILHVGEVVALLLEFGFAAANFWMIWSTGMEGGSLEIPTGACFAADAGGVSGPDCCVAAGGGDDFRGGG